MSRLRNHGSRELAVRSAPEGDARLGGGRAWCLVWWRSSVGGGGRGLVGGCAEFGPFTRPPRRIRGRPFADGERGELGWAPWVPETYARTGVPEHARRSVDNGRT